MEELARRKEPVKYEPDKSIQDLAKISLPKLQRLREIKPPNLNALDTAQSEILEELVKDEKRSGSVWGLDTHPERDIQYLRWGEDENAEEKRAKFEDHAKAVFARGKTLLRKGDFLTAFDYFEFLAEKYLDDHNVPMPKEIGQQSLEIAKTIARNWTLASALEYSKGAVGEDPELETDGYGHFRGKRIKIGGKYVQTFPAHHAIDFLARAGEIDDIPAIDIIHQHSWESNLEGHCSSAKRHIVSKNTVAVALPAIKKDLQELGMDPALSDRHLVDRIEPLADELGVTELFPLLPGLKGIASFPRSSVSVRVAADRIKNLLEHEWDTEITAEMEQPALKLEFGHLPDYTEKFGLDYGLIEPTVPEEKREAHRKKAGTWRYMGPYKFTPKGKEIMKKLLGEIAKIQVKWTG